MRRQTAAWQRNKDTKETLKLLLRLFRSNRAPYGTSKFGTHWRDTRVAMVQAFRRNPSCDFLELMLPQICNDLHEDDATWSKSKAIKHLNSVAGFLDVFVWFWLRLVNASQSVTRIV